MQHQRRIASRCLCVCALLLRLSIFLTCVSRESISHILILCLSLSVCLLLRSCLRCRERSSVRFLIPPSHARHVLMLSLFLSVPAVFCMAWHGQIDTQEGTCTHGRIGGKSKEKEMACSVSSSSSFFRSPLSRFSNHCSLSLFFRSFFSCRSALSRTHTHANAGSTR